MKLIGTKLKMTQIWKGDRVFGVTPVKIRGGVDVQTVFKDGELLKVSAVSKGKGFQGVVKRHGFHGGPKTHGQKNRHRAPGSIGNTTPQRVIPGRRMAGHMGAVRVTVRNLAVANVIPDQNIVMLHGAVPGNAGGRVEISNAETQILNQVQSPKSKNF